MSPSSNNKHDINWINGSLWRTQSLHSWFVLCHHAFGQRQHLAFPCKIPGGPTTWELFQHSIRWRHNGRDSVSNHQPHDCLLKRLFRRRSKKTSKLRITGLCAGNSPHKWSVTRKMFPFDDVIMLKSTPVKSASMVCSQFICKPTCLL